MSSHSASTSDKNLNHSKVQEKDALIENESDSIEIPSYSLNEPTIKHHISAKRLRTTPLYNALHLRSIVAITVLALVIIGFAKHRHKLLKDFQQEALEKAYKKEMEKAYKGFMPQNHEAEIGTFNTEYTQLYGKLLDISHNVDKYIPENYAVDILMAQKVGRDMEKELQKDSNGIVHQLNYALNKYYEMERQDSPRRAYHQAYVSLYSTLLYRIILPQQCAAMMGSLLNLVSQSLKSMYDHEYGSEFDPKRHNLLTYVNSVYSEQNHSSSIHKALESTSELKNAIQAYSDAISNVTDDLQTGFLVSKTSQASISNISANLPETLAFSRALMNYKDKVLNEFILSADSPQKAAKLKHVTGLLKDMKDLHDFVLKVDNLLRSLVDIQGRFYTVNTYVYDHADKLRQSITQKDSDN